MPRTLVALASLSLLALAGCGDTCGTAPAELSQVASSCTLRADSDVTVQVRLDCGNCTGKSSPTCGSEIVGGNVELTPVYQTCQGDTGCPVECGGSFSCNVHTPAASGPVTFTYPSSSGASSTTINVGAGGSTSCSL